MEKKTKEVYVPPHVTVRQVLLEGTIAVPVSVILTEESVKQEEWEMGEEASISPEGGAWILY
jgi:hypothetical protein